MQKIRTQISGHECFWLNIMPSATPIDSYIIAIDKLSKAIIKDPQYIATKQKDFIKQFLFVMKRISQIKESTDTFYAMDNLLVSINECFPTMNEKSFVGIGIPSTLLKIASDASCHFIFKRHVLYINRYLLL